MAHLIPGTKFIQWIEYNTKTAVLTYHVVPGANVLIFESNAIPSGQ